VRIVSVILIGYSLGLLASTTTRVYQSAFFALRNTATPARAAVARVLVALVAGAVLMVQFEPVTLLGYTIPAGVLESLDAGGLPLGPLGLAAGATLGAWLEWLLLRRALSAQLGPVGTGAGPVARMFAAAAAGGAAAYLTSRWLGLHALLEAVVVAGVFGSVYLLLAAALGLEQARGLAGAVLRRLRPRSR
jgi:putative peptidoglycan lipid II flippase